ncbi:hypothetical protein [Streptomyces sp. NPDC057702]|uniref:hypothetical protein n=1 Tax=unclassified Streptomyces TaxID=2593676 RepID=UPI0036AB55B6
MTYTDSARDSADTARHARFGTLPERIPYEDMVTEQAATENREPSTYHPEGSWTRFSCLALDFGL